MDAVSALFVVLRAGISIWEHKEKNKYRDRLHELHRDYYAEKTKPDPNMAILDHLEHELFLFSSSFAAAASGGQTPQASS